MEKKDIYKKITSLKPGDTFIHKNGPYKYKCHIVVNLPNEPGGRIVWKYFGKHKQWWHFEIESYYWFELRMQTPEDIKKLNFKIKKSSK